MSWLHRWIWSDFWVPVWPNIAAAVIMSTWIVRRVHKHLETHRKKIDASLQWHQQIIRDAVESNDPPAQP